MTKAQDKAKPGKFQKPQPKKPAPRLQKKTGPEPPPQHIQPLPPLPYPAPINWPPSLPYLKAPAYSPSLTAAHLTTLRTPPPALKGAVAAAGGVDDEAVEEGEGVGARPPRSSLIPSFPFPPGPSRSVLIRRIRDPEHPAHLQFGLFAARDLAPGEMIIPYLGLVHPGSANANAEEKEKEKESDYDLWLDRETDLAIDAAEMGNEARFVNDYRGVPEMTDAEGRLLRWRRPNAEFRVVWWTDLGEEGKGERGMAVFVMPRPKKAVGRARTIGVGRGEEILVSYGRGFWGARLGTGDGEGVEEKDMPEGEEGEEDDEEGEDVAA